jgi:hypothetical protein
MKLDPCPLSRYWDNEEDYLIPMVAVKNRIDSYANILY